MPGETKSTTEHTKGARKLQSQVRIFPGEIPHTSILPLKLNF